MAEEELSQISTGEFEAVSQLLASSESLQLSFIIMIVGIIGIVFGYTKFSRWVGSQKFYYQRPHFSRFLRRAVLPAVSAAFVAPVAHLSPPCGVGVLRWFRCIDCGQLALECANGARVRVGQAAGSTG